MNQFIYDVNRKDKEKSGVYIIFNNLNDKVYVGSTRNFILRFREHKSMIRKFKKFSKLGLFYHKNKDDVIFTFMILQFCDIKDLERKEQFWMDFYYSYDDRCGFNYLKWARSAKGYNHTKEAKIKISNGLKGKNNGMYGYKYTEEEILYKKSIAPCKEIIRTDKNGNFIKQYNSIMDASIELRLDKAAIGRVCSGEYKQTKGFYFKLKKDYDLSITSKIEQ